ncbi:RloB family protein [Actinomycetes bacterium KLBMP 9797]
MRRGGGDRRKDVVHIFTEDSTTEPRYSNWLKRRQDRFSVTVDDQHGKPRELLAYALELRRSWRRSDSNMSVWCVFDRDEHASVDDVICQAEQEGIRIAFSHPCFQYWLLLHFCDSAPPCAGRCREADRRLEKEMPGYQHTVPMPWLAAQLEGRYAKAKARAQRVQAQHDRDGIVLPTQRDPSTNIWELIDHLGVSY